MNAIDRLGIPLGSGRASLRAQVASTANLSLSGLPVIDGRQVQPNWTVLVKDQVNLAENGPYIARAGTWIRHPSFVRGVQFVGPVVIDVLDGAAHMNQTFAFYPNGPVSVGVTAIVFGPVNPQEHLASPFAGSGFGIEAACLDLKGLSVNNRATVRVLPGFYNENVSVPRYASITGDGFTVQVRYSGDDFGTFRLNSDTTIRDMLIEGTPFSGNWAVISEPGAGSTHIENVDILSPEPDGSPETPGEGLGNGILYSGRIDGGVLIPSKTHFIDDVVGDWDGANSRGVVYNALPLGYAGPTVYPTVNNDAHARRVFLDTLFAGSVNSGCIQHVDAFGGRVTGSVLRSAPAGFTARASRTAWSTGTADLLLEGTTCEGGPVYADAGCSVLLKHSTVDAVFGDGNALVFEQMGARIMERRGGAQYTQVNLGSRALTMTPHMERVLSMPGRGGASPGISIAIDQLPISASPTWAIEFGIQISMMVRMGGTRLGAGIRNGTSGRLIMAHLLSGDSLVVSDYANPTTFTADIGGLPSLFTPGEMLWVRIVRDATNYRFAFSTDGKAYAEFATILVSSASGMTHVFWGGDDGQINAGTGGNPPVRPLAATLRTARYIPVP